MHPVYPLLVIDIESTGLDPACYPIEIAIARRLEPGADIQLFETLIKPTATWSNNHPWLMTAQRVHGISKNDLGNAPNVFDIVKSILAWLGNDTVLISDNPFYDQRWLQMLFDAANSGALVPLVMWPDELDRDLFHKHGNPVAHRAGEDAIAILKDFEAFKPVKEQSP